MYGVSFDIARRRRVWIDRMGNRHYQTPLNQTPLGQDKCCTSLIMRPVQHLEA
jgi:hypothetical protein